jgi:hypothetical protein
VAALVARGLPERQLAARLVVTERTAATHVEHIPGKLGRCSISATDRKHNLMPPHGGAAHAKARRAPNSMSYAAVGGPNQVVSASWSPRGVRSPTQAT